MAHTFNMALPGEENSKLLKRHTRKRKQPYVIESRLPDSPIPLFTKWRFNSRYATLAQRDQALHDLRKSEHSLERFVFEYRASAGK